MNGALRKGWCPSVLRPMASGDGLIVRVSIREGRVSPPLARALAMLSRRFGNGLLDLTSRANLQLRGVSENALLPLQQELRSLGVVEADYEPAVARNILVSPLAGLDARALLDIRSSADALRERLACDAALQRLPQKFGYVLDDGGLLSLAHEKADISFLAQRANGTSRFLICLAGQIAGECAIDELADAGLRLAHVFLNLHEAPAERMAALVRRAGVDDIVSRAALSKTALVLADNPAPRPLGAYRAGAHHVLGAGIAFGRLDAAAFENMADIAEAGAAELRLTPWRAILFVGPVPVDPAALAGAGLILDGGDPLRSIAACPGAPGCASGSTATQADARQLAPFVQHLHARGIALHVSGCVKGCAHPSPAALTLVGRDGRYDLVRDGTAADRPIAMDVEPARLDLALQQFVNIDA